MVSHDLKAPIFTIKGMANALTEDCGDSIAPLLIVVKLLLIQTLSDCLQGIFVPLQSTAETSKSKVEDFH